MKDEIKRNLRHKVSLSSLQIHILEQSTVENEASYSLLETDYDTFEAFRRSPSMS